MQKLSERVYFMKYDDSNARPSLGLVIGEKQSLMIDAGNSKEQAEEFLKAAKKLGVDNLRYLGITHFHWDHVYGIPYLGLCSISSEKTQKKLKRLKAIAESDSDCEAEERNTVEYLKILKSEVELEDIDIGFEGKLRLELGGVSCIFEHIGGDHSEDSSLIYIESEKVMFLGDATYRGFSGGKRYHSLENVESLAESILKYDCEIYVTSHKEVYSREQIEAMMFRMIELGKEAAGADSTAEVEEKAQTILSEEDRFYLEAFFEHKRISSKKGGERAG
jgi:glyoxylase-like metal-dependent hydrolase (beta-lactamase superfamily II)